MQFISKINCIPKYWNIKSVSNKRIFQNQRQIFNECNNDVRLNAFGIQMLPDFLHKQIFKNCTSTSNVNNDFNKNLEDAIQHLKSFDLMGKNSKMLENTVFDLPKLYGENLNEHFIKIAQDQTVYYAEELHKLVTCSLPSLPKTSNWQKTPGWTKYISKSNGNFETCSVDCPDNGALIFDCEVLASQSDLPIIAVAVSCKAWYSWTSDHVLKNNNQLINDVEYLIPMEHEKQNNELETKCGKLVIGHNVGYDRARIKEQYFLEPTKTRFLDTMSMHIATSGFSSQQRVSVKSAAKDETNPVLKSSWLDAGSLNNLSAVHEYYCGETIDKSLRDTFTDGSMDDVVKNFNLLMDYCAKDVQSTFNVLKKLVPLFFSCFPHIVTFAGMLELGQMYLPINNNWKRYIQSCQQEYNDLNLELKRTLIDLMNDACHLLKGEKYKEDEWLWDLDWSIKHIKMIKKPRKGFVQKNVEPICFKNCFHKPIKLSQKETMFLGKEYKTSSDYYLLKQTFETANRLPLVTSHFPGAPAWYRDLQMKESDNSWNLDACNLSTLTRVTPKLLRMTWFGFPLHYYDKLGWGYLVPLSQNFTKNRIVQPAQKKITLEEIEENGYDFDKSDTMHTPSENVQDLPKNCSFHRLPHKNGLGVNVGSPLSHDFIQHIEQGRLSSADHVNAYRCLEINKCSSYWRSNWKRILTQMIMYLSPKYLPNNVIEHDNYKKELGFGAIVPKVIVCGTISRRATEQTWLTASNIESDRIGSELKSMIQAPAGYCFVGADVDSQELWIASLLGDASFVGEHGCTALSWMTIEGNKKDGTDLHSKTAQAISMTRNDAKIFNYARMYGAGRSAALRNYMQHNPNVSKEESTKRINQLYEMTKGKHIYFLSSDAQWIIRKANVAISAEAKKTNFATFDEVMKIKNAAHYAFGESRVIQSKDLIGGKKWYGGIESHMFNKLEDIAVSASPRTPALKCQISNALLPSKVGYNFLPSRMNWVVQSSAVDYLHLLIVTMRWLIEKYNLNARFVLSIHDEVHFLSSENHKYSVALALQISNLLTRCMFVHQLGMKDLPLSVAFFSSVEIDQVIRKEATDDCITPSNPSGLKAKYGIPFGEKLDIYDILRITNGKLI